MPRGNQENACQKTLINLQKMKTPAKKTLINLQKMKGRRRNGGISEPHLK
jgi:hypothetical protein